MRNNRLKKIVSLFVLLCSLTIRAQLTNGSFETNCGVATPGLCPTFTAGCIPGWFVTHGSPQLLTSGAFDGTASVYMWAAQGQSEGIGVSTGSPLINGHEYSLCFAYRVGNPENLAATLRVRLTSGVNTIVNPGCGGTPPTATFQEIGSIGISASAGWAVANITFVANAAYTQIIVFPLSNGVQVNNPAAVIVDDFRLAGQCANTFSITQTSPSISESAEQWGIIRAGSHVNGSTTTGYVTVDQPGLVVFGAAQYVSLEDNFLAIPDAADEAFLAIIEDCNSLCRILLPKESSVDALPPFPPNTDWDIINGTMSLFPNPASDQITVYSPQGLKSVVLSDISGRTVMVFQPIMNETKQTFKLSDIQAGIYLLTLTDNSGKVETKKLVIE